MSLIARIKRFLGLEAKPEKEEKVVEVPKEEVEKVAEEEKAIRTDPVARINDILKRVFGQLDKK